MEGRSKSRFPEKCKNCIWGRFPSQFWRHFEATLAPEMHFLGNFFFLEINPKKQYPPSLKWGRGGTTAKPDGSRKAPLAHALFKQETAVWAIVGHCSGFVAKTTWVGATKVKWLLKIKKFGPVGEGATKSWSTLVEKGVRIIGTNVTILNPWSCWRSGSKFLKEDTVLVIWHALGKGPANRDLVWFGLLPCLD